jgi:hypothetical protein
MSTRFANWVAFGMMVLIALGYTWATWFYFTRVVPGGNDFLTHYGAWEAYLKQGVSPYSDAAVLHTQIAIYGRPALPTEDQNRLVYPFYSILLHGPFVWIEYPLARALYMVLAQIALIVGAVLTIRFVNWRVSTGLLALVLVWALLDYHQARAILIGQFAIFGFGALAGMLALLRAKRDALAGALLVVTTIKPTLVVLVIPFLLLWGIARRRFYFVAGFFGTLALLMLGSLIVLPTWIGEWIARMTAYTGYTQNQNVIYLLTREAIPALGTPGEWILNGALLLALLGAWWRALRAPDDAEFFWTLGAMLIVSNFILPRVATTNYALMLVPTLGLFAALDRNSRWGRVAIVAIIFSALVGLWWLHIATVRGDWEHPIMYVPFPLALGAAWVFARRALIRDGQRTGMRL